MAMAPWKELEVVAQSSYCVAFHIVQSLHVYVYIYTVWLIYVMHYEVVELKQLNVSRLV